MNLPSSLNDQRPSAAENESSSEDPNEVFSYLDYRAFLRDQYHAKKDGQRLSYRTLANRIGVRSPSFVKLVLDGQRNLSEKLVNQFAYGFGLSGDAQEYFVELVDFTQAKTTGARIRAYQRLRRFRRHCDFFPLGDQHSRYHSSWFIPAVRELAAREDFVDEPEWIAQQLRPTISKDQARSALSTLRDLGLLVRGDDGKVRQGDALVSTGPESQSFYLASYHRAMMEMASQSIDRFDRTRRDISSLTLCLDEESLNALKQRLQEFRRELLELSETVASPHQVVQVNLHLFPLSAEEGEA